ncbi:MAG: anthranilate phosphoribosyltransferase [Desulfohalobiaceae bacterium]
MSMHSTLDRLALGQDLEPREAYSAFHRLFTGELGPAQTGAFLLGLKAKGETPLELDSAVRAALDQARKVDFEQTCIDTCGTGGDGKMSFNCSTAVALFLAHMGHKVVKHGNRAVSSSCGSADVLEHLGLPFIQDSQEARGRLERTNFVFLFAPHFHPAFAHVAPVRKELGIATLFNLMGPLLNPAQPSHQLLGVGSAKYLDLVARALSKRPGLRKAAVLHGAGGFDELTPCGVNQVVLVSPESCETVDIHPDHYGFQTCSAQDLACTDREQSLDLMQGVLQGQAPGPVLDMLALNLGLALYLLQEDRQLQDCMLQAANQVRQGIAREKLYAA